MKMGEEIKMNEEVLMPIESLFKVKEGELLTLLRVDIQLKPFLAEPTIGIDIEVENDYAMFVAPFTMEIKTVIEESLKLMDLQKFLSQKQTKAPYAEIALYIDENGVNVGSRFHWIENEVLMGQGMKGVALHHKLNKLLDEIVVYVTELMDEYALMKDNDEIYTPREFRFIYRKENGAWNYEGFVRMADRQISLQKSEISKLLSKDIDVKLLVLNNAEEYLENNRLQIQFYSDGLSINNMKIGSYNM